MLRQDNVATSQYLWRKQYLKEVSPQWHRRTVVPPYELVAAMKQINQLQRLLDKKTMANELIKESVEYRYTKMESTHSQLRNIVILMSCYHDQTCIRFRKAQYLHIFKNLHN